MGDLRYEAYLQKEWEAFFSDSSRAQASIDAARGTQVRKLLDVGSGAGQEMVPFTKQGAFGVGADLSPDAGLLARRLFDESQPRSRVAFVRAAAERLPFASESFDLVICRVALPYMDNERALTEMSRVLRPEGLMLLKIHHARYYIRQFSLALRRGMLRSMIHATRVLISGGLYLLLGRQVLRSVLGNEIFQTRRSLERAVHPMRIRGEMPGSRLDTPAFVIEKQC